MKKKEVIENFEQCSNFSEIVGNHIRFAQYLPILQHVACNWAMFLKVLTWFFFQLIEEHTFWSSQKELFAHGWQEQKHSDKSENKHKIGRERVHKVGPECVGRTTFTQTNVQYTPPSGQMDHTYVKCAVEKLNADIKPSGEKLPFYPAHQSIKSLMFHEQNKWKQNYADSHLCFQKQTRWWSHIIVFKVKVMWNTINLTEHVYCFLSCWDNSTLNFFLCQDTATSRHGKGHRNEHMAACAAHTTA